MASMQLNLLIMELDDQLLGEPQGFVQGYFASSRKASSFLSMTARATFNISSRDRGRAIGPGLLNGFDGIAAAAFAA
ncbi:hypothetical protein [Consotaella aegiceratis]|uniref:hypothetical protein n=1 Tax=Consotaella aegiceratis TaxID=3097961 RepID=UPI002F3E2826